MKLIKNWTQELRYRPYQQWDENYLTALKKAVEESSWRLGYHIQPETGLLNDPNGFSFFNGKWQLFYQVYPMGPVHGLKSWFHLTSKNLVDWQAEGIALHPDHSFDSHGVYSGSALPIDDKLFLAYTGNVRDQDWQRSAYQLGAWMDQENQIQKIAKPLIAPNPKGYTAHFRDPQLFSYQNQYFMLVGAQAEDLTGKILTYQSTDLENWQLLGELSYTDEEMGFMVECPNLIFIEGRPVLIFCPQGLDSKILAYQNIYPNTFLVADDFKPEENSLINPSSLRNLDEGFDVYATQAFNAPDGRGLGISWIGLPEIEYPSDQEGWAHCLSIVKEFKLKGSQLLQQPVAEMQDLRQEESVFKGRLSEESKKIAEPAQLQYELNLSLEAGAVGKLDLLVAADGEQKFTLDFDTVHGKMTLNRKNSGVAFATEFGVERSFEIAPGELTLQIFVDQSVIEIFINNGEQTATARVFPKEFETAIELSGNDLNYSGALWILRKMK